jgi:hypothetical protein
MRGKGTGKFGKYKGDDGFRMDRDGAEEMGDQRKKRSWDPRGCGGKEQRWDTGWEIGEKILGPAWMENGEKRR